MKRASKSRSTAGLKHNLKIGRPVNSNFAQKKGISRTLFTVLLLSVFTYAAMAQTGPAGVGNADGTLSQPKNVMWFDAGTLGLSNGTAVETWTDLSGNNNHAQQTTAASRPTYTTGEINGLPAVVFDGSNDFMPFDGNLIANSDYTVIFVGKRRTSNTFKAFLGGTTSEGNRNLHLYWYNSSQFRAHHYGNDLQTNMVGTSESYADGTNNNDYGAFATLLSSTESSDQRRNYQNNHYLGSRSNSAKLTDYLGSALGRYNTGYHDVTAAEVIFYSTALNDAQLQVVYQYINIKYNIDIDNDLYNPLASHSYDVVGVGTTDGTQKHTQTASSSGGMLLSELNSTFDENNEFVFASHDNTAAAEVATDLPALGTGILEGRSARQWYVAKTSTTTDISIGFELTETGLAPGSGNQLFYLLFKANTGDAYTTVTGGQAINSNGTVWFNIEDGNFATGYYTIARSDQTAFTWYSYNTGDWDNWQNWSLEAGGADIVNPNMYTPSTSPTSAVDKVVILHPYQIKVSTNGKENAILEVRDGTINFGATTGHNFAAITGQGTIKLAADNFPTGNATEFVASTGGTVEYNGTGHNLATARTFNNLTINLTGATDVVTLLADYQLNGSLDVENGILQINDNTSTTILTLDIEKDVTVQANGQITVGEGNTIGSYSIGGTMPDLGMYHAIFHQLKIGGNLTNEGLVKLTNLAAPNYGQFADNGAVTVTFDGAQDNLAQIDNTAIFYNLIIDKGVDQTYIQTLYSANDDYFQLYGPNNVGRRTGGIYTGANPEVRKALWIKNGTLKLDGYISLPSLTEGGTSGGNGDYPIPANGCLWIAGEGIDNVMVYSTARTASAELIPGTSGVNDGSGNQALSVYGKFKITNGYFNTRNSAGFIFWADENAVIEIAGGLCDVAQFRSAHGGVGGKTSFLMSGGELMVRGNEQFTYDLDAGPGYQINPDGGGEITGSYPAFGIIDEDGVFQMDGGKLYIADRSGNNEYESNGLCIDAKTVNHNATGGEVIFLMKNNEDYDIKTLGELYNVTLINRTGTTQARLHMGENLSVKGDLSIGNYTQLIARKQHSNFNTAVKNLQVARSFSISTIGDYRPFGNTTTLLVTYSSSISLSNTNQEFFNLVIKNNPDLPSTNRPIRGNSNTITVHNDLTIETGAVVQFRTGDKTLLVKGNINNSGTINNHSTDDGKVLLSNSGIVSDIVVTFNGVYDNTPTITIDPPPAGGTQATAIPVFNGIPSATNRIPLAGIEITNSGSGYETAPSITISAGYMGFATATAVATINTQHEIAGNGNGVFHHVEIDEPHPDESAGKQTVSYLTANTKITGTLTLTHGIFDLDTYGLDLEGTLSSESEANYSETKLIRMEGNHGDGGLTRTIAANGTFLYPIGTYNTTAMANRLAWAKPTISGYADNGKLQINAVPKKLPTLAASATNSYLNYYWRTRFSDFTTVPQIQNSFNSYVSDYSVDGTLPDYKIGKVVGATRYGDDAPDDLGTLEGASGGLRLLNYSIAQDVEDGAFTAAFADYFVGSVQVFYSYFSSWPGWYSASWTNPAYWSKTPHGEPDRGTTSNSGYPQAGDIAVIGRGDHSDYGTPGFHSINIFSGTNVQCAEIRIDGGRLVVNSGSTVNAGLVTGTTGTFMARTGGALPTVNADFSDFANGNGDFNYYISSNLSTTGYTDKYPNLRIEGGSTVTFENDFTVNGNFTIDGNTNYVTHNGGEGNFTVSGELRLGGYLGGTLSFNTDINSREVVVKDIRFSGADHTGSLRRIHVLNSSPNELEHKLKVTGDIFNDAGTNIEMSLFTNNTTGNNVILEFEGDSDQEFQNLNVASIPSLYKLFINKGSNQTPTVTINNNFTLNGPTDGLYDEKALYLQAGTLKLNHADIDITLTSGGDDFLINSNSQLWVNQGTARVTDPASGGIFLDGTLSVQGEGAERGEVILDGGVGSDNYIEYSSSGNALLDIRGGYLWVGSQIRSSTQNNLGVLRYRQLAGTPSGQVYIGMRSAPENTRGVFEIFNPGSQFQMYNGDIYIGRGHDVPATATRAAVYIDPASTGLNKWGNLRIGHATTPASSTITINATPDLCRMYIDNNVTAKLITNSLSLAGPLDINAGSIFDGNGLNLTLYDDIDNAGTTNLNVDSLVFVGVEQEIIGDIGVQNMVVEPTTSVTTRAGADVTVSNELIIRNGALNDNGETIVVEGNYTNNSAHASSGTGRIKLAGSALQNIYGNGDFGNLELDNAAGGRLGNSINMTGDLYLTNGVFDIQAFNLNLSETSQIQGSGFSSSKMIASNGSFADLGLTVNIPSGAQTFTLPIGIISGVDYKYTPVTFDITASDNPGSIRLYGVNQPHMTTTGTDVLQYYWTVASSGLSNFNAEMTLNYLDADVVGTEANYISAHLYDDSWAKFDVSTVDESANTILYTFPGVSTISGDFTAGIDPHIPTNIPIYENLGNGVWTDVTNWFNVDGYTVPAGGPNGHIVRIAAGTTVTMDRFRIQSYRTELNGRLEVGTEVGHNIGRVSGGGTLALVSEKWPVGDFTQFMAAGTGSTIEYGGGTYAIPEVNNNYYNNLVITDAGTKTTPNKRFYVRNDLLVTGGATFETTNYFHLYGNFTLEASSRYYPRHYIAFNQNRDQIIDGDFTGLSAFKYVEMSKTTNTNSVTFTRSGEVASTFFMIRGIFKTTNSEKLTLKNGIYSGSEAYINSGQTWVDGNLTILLNNGSSSSGTTNLFPIGKNGKRRYVRLNNVNNSGVAKSAWTARYDDENPADNSLDIESMETALKTISANEYWTISGPSGGSTAVSVMWGEESGVDAAYLTDLKLAQWDGSQWVNKAGTASGDAISGVVANTNASTFNAKNVAKYFTLGSTSDNQPLPVELVEFDAQVIDHSNVKINWATAAEKENDYFIVEKSRDGVVFTQLQTVRGAGYSSELLNYQILDQSPYDGISYYRLTQVDFNGDRETFPMVSVRIEQSNITEPDLNIYPNPYFQGELHVDISGINTQIETHVMVVDLAGNVIMSQNLFATSENLSTTLGSVLAEVSSGFYIVTIINAETKIARRIVKK